MEKLDSVIEAFFRARDNYATGGRTVAFLLAAGLAFWIEEGGKKDVDPWVLGLFAAGLLSLFALIANKLRARRQKPIDRLNNTREQLEELLTSLENLVDNDSAEVARPDALAATSIAMTKAKALLRHSNMKALPERLGDEESLQLVRSAVRARIGECVDKVAELENRPGWLKRAASWLKDAGSFSFRS